MLKHLVGNIGRSAVIEFHYSRTSRRTKQRVVTEAAQFIVKTTYALNQIYVISIDVINIGATGIFNNIHWTHLVRIAEHRHITRQHPGDGLVGCGADHGVLLETPDQRRACGVIVHTVNVTVFVKYF